MPTFNADAMTMLAGMGFPEVRCQKALLATANENAELAMEWLFAHMEDPGTFSSPPSHHNLSSNDVRRYRRTNPATWSERERGT